MKPLCGDAIAILHEAEQAERTRAEECGNSIDASFEASSKANRLAYAIKVLTAADVYTESVSPAMLREFLNSRSRATNSGGEKVYPGCTES